MIAMLTPETGAAGTPSVTTRALLPFLGGLAIVVAILTAAAFLWCIPRGVVLHFDFRSMYTAGYLERTHPSELFSVDAQKDVQVNRISNDGSTLPFFHPPGEALLFVPFSLLPYSAAYVAFIFFNGLITAACVVAGMKLFSVTIPLIQPRPGLMLLFFFPLYMAIIAGQDSVLFLLVLLLAWKHMEQNRDWNAGLILAVGLFKPQIVLPLVLLMSLRRGRNLAKGFGWGAAGVLALNFLCAPANPIGLLRLLQGSTGGHTRAVWYVRPLMMANVRGVIYGSLRNSVSEHGQLFATIAVSALIFGIVAFWLLRIRSEMLAFSVSLLASVLISYHLYPHDLIVLAIPILAIAEEVRRWKNALIFLLYVCPWIFFWAGNHLLYLTAFPVAIALGVILIVAQRRVEALPAKALNASC